jgi:hypothetical protein
MMMVDLLEPLFCSVQERPRKGNVFVVVFVADASLSSPQRPSVERQAGKLRLARETSLSRAVTSYRVDTKEKSPWPFQAEESPVTVGFQIPKLGYQSLLMSDGLWWAVRQCWAASFVVVN